MSDGTDRLRSGIRLGRKIRIEGIEYSIQF